MDHAALSALLAKVADATSQKARYIKTRAFDD